MSCEVNVPRSRRDEIAALGLSVELVAQVYERLAADLEFGHRDTLLRLAGPVMTFVYSLPLMDPVVPQRRHLFDFLLEEAGDEYHLVVTQVNHEVRDGWWSHPEDGGPGSPEDEDASPP